jgi:thiamine-monophosphate kinase
MKTIKNVGEFGLIDIIKNRAKYISSEVYGIGDDCAIIPCKSEEFVITTDTLVEGVHFFSDIDPYILGRKSLSVNVSDIAAMAAKPKWALLSISCPIKTPLDYIEKFIDGFYSVAGEFDIALIGGDTTKSSEFTITVTLIGQNSLGKSIKRSGAKIGNFVYVTGKIGCSYAGFFAIKNKIDGFDKLKDRHLNPKPKIKEALAVRAFASAMIDISDGFLQDCGHICEKSQVGMRIDFEKIPFCDVNFIDKKDMLAGGEDYELIFCSDKKYADIIEKIPDITKVGEVVEGCDVVIEMYGERMNFKTKGFKHF